MSQFSLSQSVCSQTNLSQALEDEKYIRPYWDVARRMFEEATNSRKGDKKKNQKSKRPKSGSTQRSNENKETEDDYLDSQPFLQEDQPASVAKKRRRDIECLSLSVSESDLDDYGILDDTDDTDDTEDDIDDENDEDYVEDDSDDDDDDTDDDVDDDIDDDEFQCVNNGKTDAPDEILLSSGSSSLSSVTEGEVTCLSRKRKVKDNKKKKEKKRRKQHGEGAVFSNYIENNRNGKKVIHLDSDSDDEITDDGSEAHVVCFICGKYNTKKKFYLWISCTLCKNWFHKDCTDLWRKKIKDIEKDNFVCRYH